MSKKISSSLMLLTMLILLFTTGCGPDKINSTSRYLDITIDGDKTDWKQALVFDSDKNISYGFMNDSENLYLCLVSTDQDIQRAVMMQGMNIWFSTEKKTGGFQYPLGMAGHRMDRENGMSSQSERRTGPPKMSDEIPSSVKVFESKKSTGYELELAELADNGVEIAIKNSRGLWIYEVKIPLIETDKTPYATAFTLPEQLKIAFETPEIESEEMGGGPGGGMGGPGGGGGSMGGPGGGGRGGGMGGGGRGGGMSGGGGRGGMGGGQRPEQPESFEWEVQLTLAVN